MSLLRYFLWKLLVTGTRQEGLIGDRQTGPYFYKLAVEHTANVMLPTYIKKDDAYTLELASLFIGVVGAVWLDDPAALRKAPTDDHLTNLVTVVAQIHDFFASRRSMEDRAFTDLRREVLEYDAREPQRFATRMFNFLRGHMRGDPAKFKLTKQWNELMNVWFAWMRPWKHIDNGNPSIDDPLRKLYQTFVVKNFRSYTVLLRDLLAMQIIFVHSFSLRAFADKRSVESKALTKIAKTFEIFHTEPNISLEKLLKVLKPKEKEEMNHPSAANETNEPYRPLFDEWDLTLLPDVKHLYIQMDTVEKQVTPELKRYDEARRAKSGQQQGSVLGFANVTGKPVAQGPTEQEKGLKEALRMTEFVKDALKLIWSNYKSELEACVPSNVQSEQEEDTNGLPFEEQRLQKRRTEHLRRLWLYPLRPSESSVMIKCVCSVADWMRQKLEGTPDWLKGSEAKAEQYLKEKVAEQKTHDATERPPTLGIAESGYLGLNREELLDELAERKILSQKKGLKALRRQLVDDDRKQLGVLGVRHFFAVYRNADEGCEYLLVAPRLVGLVHDHEASKEHKQPVYLTFRLEHTTMNGITLRPSGCFTQKISPIHPEVFFQDKYELIRFYTQVPFGIERVEQRDAKLECTRYQCSQHGGCPPPHCHLPAVFYMYLDKLPTTSTGGMVAPHLLPRLHQLRWFARYRVLVGLIVGFLVLYLTVQSVKFKFLLFATLLYVFVILAKGFISMI
jgi:hypothetical protein